VETAVENGLPYSLSARWAPGLSEKVELQDFNQQKGTPMTDDRLALSELAAKSGDSDFLRAIAESVLQLIMEADVDGLIGAGRYARSGIERGQAPRIDRLDRAASIPSL